MDAEQGKGLRRQVSRRLTCRVLLLFYELWIYTRKVLYEYSIHWLEF
jgi:hypothetical protein